MFTDIVFPKPIHWVWVLLLGSAIAGQAALAADATYNCIPLDAPPSPDGKAGEWLFPPGTQLTASPSGLAGSGQLPATATAALPTASPASTPADTDGFYIVQRGDTLYAVMRKTGVPIKNLIVLNQLPSPYGLQAGQPLKLSDVASAAQPLKLPADTVSSSAGIGEAQVDKYVVRIGDTLYAISRQTGISIERLISINQLSAPYSIIAGQQLKLR